MCPLVTLRLRSAHIGSALDRSEVFIATLRELVFSWIIEQDNGTEWLDYYNTLFTYDFIENSWSQGELIYISNQQLSVPENSDMEYFPGTIVSGCTDPTAINYDPDAEINDG